MGDAARKLRTNTQAGRRFGDWVVTDKLGQRGTSLMYRVKCVRCGTTQDLLQQRLYELSDCPCDPEQPERVVPPIGEGRVVVDHWSRWEDDDRCWYMVAHYGEMTRGEVADLMGIHPDWVRQIEQRALHKLREVCEAEGLSEADVLAAMQGQHSDWDYFTGEE
jgi:hypothetical protein